MSSRTLPRHYNPYGNRYDVPDAPKRETVVDRFVKGTVWRTTQPMKVRHTDIPVGTIFEVVYPRRRESDLVAVKFSGITFARRAERRGSAPLSRTRKGRFHKADELVYADRLAHAEIVTLPGSTAEYYIRRIEDQKLWSGGNLSPAGFAEVPFSEANHYVSADNARVGIVTLMFREHRTLPIGDTPSWEIVGYDALTGKVVETISIHPAWWTNMLRLSRLFHSLPKPVKDEKRNRNTLRQRVRRVANALSIDAREWSYLVFLDFKVNGGSSPSFVDQRDKALAKMSNSGIEEYHLGGDNIILLVHDTDRVMMKLLFAEDVHTHALV